ncbi:MAG: PilZ domain-containing protein [Candidatus Omnitrophica bacterium]|nr:PilZ domain-containing protein [Candidatus Omnitrophota bacterium]MCM8790268.1 PilZ domain-containing protein [Candidatus Omnitrophota bacterium]
MVKKIRDIFVERRRYVRLQTPIPISYTVPETGSIHNTSTKNISADGLRFETFDKELKEDDLVELKLGITGAPNPVHAKGKVIWKKKISLEDAAPFDCGMEFTEIEEDNKNTFLKFLCDLIYAIRKEQKRTRKKD